MAGFEPVTFRVTGGRSNQLSYIPTPGDRGGSRSGAAVTSTQDRDYRTATAEEGQLRRRRRVRIERYRNT